MSRTRRTPRPWDYRWQTWAKYEASQYRWNRRGYTLRWSYAPWTNHQLSWGASRTLELTISKRRLRQRTRAAMRRQLAFSACSCGTRWACPLHGGLPDDTPDWHPGVVRVGYWD